MAGADKEEFAPLLRPGFHPHRVEEVRRLCVARFGSSLTRDRIMVRLEQLVELINKTAIKGEIWIDGSFLTEKLNPDDVDLIFVISGDQFRALTAEQRRFFDWFRSTSLYPDYKCDNYVLVRDEVAIEAEYQYAYWLRQFGFSRGNAMKGLAVVSVPFLVRS